MQSKVVEQAAAIIAARDATVTVRAAEERATRQERWHRLDASVRESQQRDWLKKTSKREVGGSDQVCNDVWDGGPVGCSHGHVAVDKQYAKSLRHHMQQREIR